MHALITLDGKGYALIRTYALINMGVYNNGYKASRDLNSYIGIVVGTILLLCILGMPFYLQLLVSHETM